MASFPDTVNENDIGKWTRSVCYVVWWLVLAVAWGLSANVTRFAHTSLFASDSEPLKDRRPLKAEKLLLRQTKF